MSSSSASESTESPAPGIIPEPMHVQDQPTAAAERSAQRAADRASTPPPTQAKPRRGLLGKLLAALRGDKYMVDAYSATTEPGTKE